MTRSEISARDSRRALAFGSFARNGLIGVLVGVGFELGETGDDETDGRGAGVAAVDIRGGDADAGGVGIAGVDGLPIDGAAVDGLALMGGETGAMPEGRGGGADRAGVDADDGVVVAGRDGGVGACGGIGGRDPKPDGRAGVCAGGAGAAAGGVGETGLGGNIAGRAGVITGVNGGVAPRGRPIAGGMTGGA